MDITITNLEIVNEDQTCIRYVVEFNGTSVGCTYAPGVNYTEESAKEHITSLYAPVE